MRFALLPLLVLTLVTPAALLAEDTVDEPISLRRYDIRGLLHGPPNHPAPQLNHPTTQQPERSIGAILFRDDDEPSVTAAERLEMLITLIQDSVGNPLEWAAAGGDVSSIREMDGILWVKTLASRHNEIQRILTDMRADRGGQVGVDVIVAARSIDLDTPLLNEPPLLTEQAARQFLQSLKGNNGRIAAVGRNVLQDAQRGYVVAAGSDLAKIVEDDEHLTQLPHAFICQTRVTRDGDDFIVDLVAQSASAESFGDPLPMWATTIRLRAGNVAMLSVGASRSPDPEAPATEYILLLRVRPVEAPTAQ